MSNGSGQGAVRPSVNGQRQNDQSGFFAQVAQWAMHAPKTGRTKGKPPRIPVELDRDGQRQFFHGRGIFKAMFDRMVKNDSVDIQGWCKEDIESEFMEPILDALLALNLHPEVPEGWFEEFRSELKKLGFDSNDTLDMCIENESDPKEGSFGDDEFDSDPPDDTPSPSKPTRDGGKPTTKPAKATKPARKAETVADMGDEKSARTDEKPAKAVDTFAKMFDWIGRLKIPASRRLMLAELVRFGHDCPAMTWVGNSELAKNTRVLRRQVQRTLRLLESAGHITIRNYHSQWCKTQRVVFINRLAERAGVDPKTVNLPPVREEFFRLKASIRAKLESAKKPASPAKAVTTNPIGCHTGHPIGELPAPIGCPVRHRGGVMHDTRRDKGFSAPNGAEKTHTPIVVSPSPPRGGLTPTGVEENAKPAPSAKPVPGSEHAAVGAKKVSTARPPMDWPERNLPTANRETELARMVRLGRVTHLHPRWLDGLACWVVRCRKIDGQDVFLPPKSIDDGWIVNTVDAVVVPLIDPENRRVSQDKFRRLIAAGPMVAPDPDKPVVEPG